MKVAGVKKVFTDEVVEDIPLPEVPPHTHDGQNSQLLAPDSVDTIQIRSGAVTTDIIADEAVGSTKLIPESVLTEHLDALAITEAKLANAAVATAKIKNGAVNASKLIQTEAVITVSAQIESATIISAHIGTGVIQNAHLGNAIVTNAKIVDATIQTAKIGDAQITNAKIGLAAVDNANIANAAITSAKIGLLAVQTANIADLAVLDAKIASLTAAKITAGQFNLTSTGYLSAPYGGLRFGYLRSISGTPIYGIQAGPGHGLMLDDGANGYARMWVDDSGNRPLCIDTTDQDRLFIKASSGNDIIRFYGNNAVSGGFVDVRTSFRIGTTMPSSPSNGEMYYETSPSGVGAGGRLRVYNGFSWHYVAWFDDI